MNKKPIENKALKAAIQKLKDSPSKETEIAFFEEFKNTKVIVPVKFKPQPKTDKHNNLVLSKNVEINFLLINDVNKKNYYPAFLDFESFNNWKKGNKEIYNIAFDYKGFYNLLNEKNNVAVGVALDPFGLNIICNKSLINKLNQPETNKTEEKPLISDPKVYPTSMVNALYDCCVKNNDINKAYLKSFVYPHKMAFGIIVDKKGSDEIFKELENVALPFSKGIELVFVNIDDEIVKNGLKAHDVPFYER